MFYHLGALTSPQLKSTVNSYLEQLVEVLDHLGALASPRLCHEQSDGIVSDSVSDLPLVAVDGQPRLQHLHLPLSLPPVTKHQNLFLKKTTFPSVKQIILLHREASKIGRS